MTLPDLQPWLEEWSRLWGVPELCRETQIAPSARLRRSLGVCNPTTGRIRLHPRLVEEPPSLLREVVCHELAHFAVRRLHGRAARPHGAEWKAMMRAAGYEPRARLNAEDRSAGFQAAIRPAALFRHRCPACGAARTALRRFRRWRCRRCREAGREGRLEITRQAAESL